MNLLYSQKIKCEKSDSNEENIIIALKKAFKTTTEGTLILTENGFSCYDINNCFGAILRKDITHVSVKATRNDYGYIIETETIFKPSIAFWVFCIIDLLLIETIIGTIIGFGITFGLFFYNKKLVETTIIDILKRIKEEFE